MLFPYGAFKSPYSLVFKTREYKTEIYSSNFINFELKLFHV